MENFIASKVSRFFGHIKISVNMTRVFVWKGDAGCMKEEQKARPWVAAGLAAGLVLTSPALGQAPRAAGGGLSFPPRRGKKHTKPLDRGRGTLFCFPE